MIRKYGTQVMTDDECLLFVQTAIDNGVEIDTAIQDMKTIDNLLAIERLFLLARGSISRTSRGYVRKNSNLMNAIESVITARAEGKEM